MSLRQILDIEGLGFVYGLVAVVAWKLLTGSINLHGLLADKSAAARISPHRIQLLISTLLIAVECLRQIVQQGAFPPLGSGLFYLMGGSHLIYATGKLLEKYPIGKRTGA